MNAANPRLRNLSSTGFSLIELLVVIAIIGLVLGIVMPNIGGTNMASREVSARRNAQTVAYMATAAQAAGVSLPVAAAPTPETSIYSALAVGVSPTTGLFKGRQFIVPSLPPIVREPELEISAEAARILKYLSWDDTNQILNYVGSSESQ